MRSAALEVGDGAVTARVHGTDVYEVELTLANHGIDSSPAAAEAEAGVPGSAGTV
ncbi:hypothetical protein ACFVFJ_48205 [Streptomyces sp. NPDC057717]|uniref:hypothetical protein n=1 Tax=Streptomyces sp. NPDC057717 TaxID=3346224 RepID=UPI00369F16EB